MIEVVAALIWKNEKFMICQRPRNKARALFWEFVGGKVEEGETKEQALIRECREELNITVEPIDIFTRVKHTYPDIEISLTLYNCKITEGTPQLIEHNDMQWITPPQIPMYQFCPADEAILNLIVKEYENQLYHGQTNKKNTQYLIRKITKKDDKEIENIIRSCLVEFGANHDGTAWADPNLGDLSNVYSESKSCYWVAEDPCGKLVGGVGIGPLNSCDGVCELQKFYCLPFARGTGLAQKLMDTALSFACKYYRSCYLETLGNMNAAQKFYEKYGFQRLPSPLGETGHFACDFCYFKNLQKI